MDTLHYDIEGFTQGLVDHGLILPTAVPGTFGRGPVFEDVLERFDALVLRTVGVANATQVTFPPIIDRAILEKVHYLDSFPHLCGSIHSFSGNALQALAVAERARAGGNWGELLSSTGVVLTPAACYPVYPTWAGTLPAQGKLVTLIGWVYRHEPSPEPTRMQSFRVREYICAGTPAQVLAWRDEALAHGIALLKGLQLPAHEDVASDPFFGRGGRMLAAAQVEQKLKFEVLVPVISREHPTAVCSFNYHQEHFGGTFGIYTQGGAVAHTACLGYGMERVTMALFRTHGYDVAQWPQAVRAQLWP
jgi:seryl-tRNA synthetase